MCKSINYDTISKCFVVKSLPCIFTLFALFCRNEYYRTAEIQAKSFVIKTVQEIFAMRRLSFRPSGMKLVFFKCVSLGTDTLVLRKKVVFLVKKGSLSIFGCYSCFL